MARNEEKQQGRLNRLWLQKEREEGRLKDVRETRPKLYTLHTAASVKKWIPSIKNEIEYYLQQSQLPHYPERKIAEFQLKIEALEKEYKSFITKLRVLDPSCKHQPWTPRAYCKRRADQPDSHNSVKKPHAALSEGIQDFNEDGSGGQAETCCMRNQKTSLTKTLLNYTETRILNPSSLDNPEQDLPLMFDESRLAVAVAAFRGSSAALELTKTNDLARVLQSGLPNLGNSVIAQANHQELMDKTQRLIESTMSTNECTSSAPEEEAKSSSLQQVPGGPLSVGGTTDRGHLLGLDCYSSSDDDGGDSL
ncbi:unnamed protein product [Knipowitschia caucasica]|uniref:Uncharacterized protein n=1 Tax=Knipowitschia caucasica TaxID=637954 RepID=A0AAV2KSC6_KNICA